MSEYLFLSKDGVLYRIESSEIIYIVTGASVSKNNTLFVLTNGERISVHMSLQQVNKIIGKYFKNSYNNFRFVGGSMIINMVHLYAISTNKIGFVNRRADGYSTGYSAGYRDGRDDRPPKIDVQSNVITEILPKDPLAKLKSELIGTEKKSFFNPESLKNLKKKNNDEI